ncbi:MAG TPA: hypothetical protein VN897_11585, partial [Mycobacterium sp.]|nr:hypothetical protein [Mycobacterium sp.]
GGRGREAARALRLCEPSCRARGISEMSCGPDDMIVSMSVPLAVPADWAAAAAYGASPPSRRFVAG